MIPDQVYDEHSAYKGNHLQVKNFVFVVTICHQQCFQCLHACPCVPGGQIRTTWKLTTVLKKKSVLRFRTPKMLHQKHANIKQKNPYSTWYLASATPSLWKWVLLPRVGGKLTVGSWACTYYEGDNGIWHPPDLFLFIFKRNICTWYFSFSLFIFFQNLITVQFSESIKSSKPQSSLKNNNPC